MWRQRCGKSEWGRCTRGGGGEPCRDLLGSPYCGAGGAGRRAEARRRETVAPSVAPSVGPSFADDPHPQHAASSPRAVASVRHGTQMLHNECGHEVRHADAAKRVQHSMQHALGPDCKPF
eukprot:233722-Chlamydomonas_euryale.AAC.1